MNADKIIEKEKRFVMQTYARHNLVVDYGKDCMIYDKEGRSYIDMLGGIACTPAGHGNKEVAEAVSRQAHRLANISNLYYTEEQVKLAEKLAELSGLRKCFFCNSGAEANEAAIKLARKITGKKEIISTKNAFHGRTLGALSATWNKAYQEPFRPLVEGFSHVEYGDAEAIGDAITDDTAAAIVEPIQGEAGVVVPKDSYLKEVRKICDRNSVLLIIDEVQTGNGRTGKFFAYQHHGIKPDIVTTAKGLANGLPIGVAIAKEGIDFDRGNHASTFGGNSISCAAANAMIEFMLKEKLMENAVIQGNYLMEELRKLGLRDVRGKGLMVGAEIDNADKIVKKCIDEGLVTGCAHGKVLRFLPPLTITKEKVDEAMEILGKVLNA